MSRSTNPISPSPDNRRLWRWERPLAALALSMWWGGLTVYALIVVPVGAELFGSTEQGFVTQRVTHWLNLLAALALLTTIRTVYRAGGRWMWINWCGLLATLVALLLIHRQLDVMLAPELRSVTDSERFYHVHRLYLWTTTLQWLAGLGLLWPLLGGSQSDENGVSGDQSQSAP